MAAIEGLILCSREVRAYILTPLTREAAIAAVKIVFPQPAFQLLYSAHAQVNMMKEGLPWLLYIW